MLSTIKSINGDVVDWDDGYLYVQVLLFQACLPHVNTPTSRFPLLLHLGCPLHVATRASGNILHWMVFVDMNYLSHGFDNNTLEEVRRLPLSSNGW